jgi:CBS domain-containing protein
MSTAVKSIMTTKLITIPSGSSLFEANRLMKEKRIRHLPVVDEGKNIIGVISQRDLSAIPDSQSVPVDWMMSGSVQAVDQSLSLRQAIFVMLQFKISSLLVTAEDDEVVGIVTTDDMLWHLAHLLSEESEAKSHIGVAVGLETIGNVASRLSDMGL